MWDCMPVEVREGKVFSTLNRVGNCILAGDVTTTGISFTVDSDLSGKSPQFTIICTSTGGPATTVTWTRDSETVSGGMTVLDDPVTAQYTHTLTVTERLGGQYQCTVSNNKPSQDSASFTVQGERESLRSVNMKPQCSLLCLDFPLLPPVASAPTNLMAVQEGSTGIRVSWTPPTPLGDTTGYRIYYSGGSSGSVDVSGGSSDDHLLTGLRNGASYTISIVGTSEHFFSDRVDYPSSIPLSEFLQLLPEFQRGTS